MTSVNFFISKKGLPNVSPSAVIVWLGPGAVLVGHGQDEVRLLVGVVGRVVLVHVVT